MFRPDSFDLGSHLTLESRPERHARPPSLLLHPVPHSIPQASSPGFRRRFLLTATSGATSTQAGQRGVRRASSSSSQRCLSAMPGRPPAESEARGSAPISSTESDPRARAGCSVARSTGEGGVLGEEEHWRGHRPRRRVSGELGDGRSAMVNSRSRVLRYATVFKSPSYGRVFDDYVS
jgi:hypothetical protein